MMEFLYYPLGFLLLLGIVVTVHEFGHYFAARIVGVHILRFSVGFGKAILSFKNSLGTEFTLAVIPLGGYVKLLGEEPEEQKASCLTALGQPPKPRLSFVDLSNWQKIFIALAGPAANFVLSILVFTIVAASGSYEPAPLFRVDQQNEFLSDQLEDHLYKIVAVDNKETSSWGNVQLALAQRLGDSGTIGFFLVDIESAESTELSLPILNWHRDNAEPDLLSSLGINPGIYPWIGKVAENSPAMDAGIKLGDLVMEVNGQPVKYWRDLVEIIESSPNRYVDMSIVRGGRSISLRPVIGVKSNDEDERGLGYLGVGPSVNLVKSDMIKACLDGVVRTWEMTVMTLSFFKKMLFGELSPGNLMGPIGIAKVAGEVVQTSLTQFLMVLALMSLSLGIINLMPIPMLDGGMVLLNVVELIMGKPVPESIQVVGFQLGIVLVGGLFVFVTYNDFLRIF